MNICFRALAFALPLSLSLAILVPPAASRAESPAHEHGVGHLNLAIEGQEMEIELVAPGADVVGLNCGRGPETMFPILKDIRQKVSGHVAALPVPYRTNQKRPCFFELRLPEGKNAFPVALDPFLLTRFEMADFTLQARDMGINYIGICCGAGPHHVRAMAEALGRTVTASEYSPDLTLHPIIGDENARKKRYRECLLGPIAYNPDAER